MNKLVILGFTMLTSAVSYGADHGDRNFRHEELGTIRTEYRTEAVFTIVRGLEVQKFRRFCKVELTDRMAKVVARRIYFSTQLVWEDQKWEDLDYFCEKSAAPLEKILKRAKDEGRFVTVTPFSRGLNHAKLGDPIEPSAPADQSKSEPDPVQLEPAKT